MVRGLWGKKIGMTQLFDKDKVIPVTAVDLSSWIVTNIRRKDVDGYDAVQVGKLREKYVSIPFSMEWLKQLKKHFSHIREISVDDVIGDIKIGQPAEFFDTFQLGDTVDVSGVSKGRGFQGVVKRHGFAGPPASHGSTMGKRPGSIGGLTACGKVIKGKKLPGHLGAKACVIRGLEVILIKPDEKIMLIKGSVPGKAGSVLFLKKA